jgi:NADP-dependent 3-hydroxy acid dehydrogenase YdfG
MRSSTTDSPVWFITGCSSGFGREFVRAALAHGFRVVATARDPKKLGDLIAGREDKAKVLALDVTNADHIKRAVSEAERTFGRIDVLVNNATAMAIWLRLRKERRKTFARYSTPTSSAWLQ